VQRNKLRRHLYAILIAECQRKMLLCNMGGRIFVAAQQKACEQRVSTRMAITTIKKYSNRRLYDTEESRYITIEELTERIREGTDVRIVDAKSNEDLTQATLVQIVLDTKATRFLPVPLLARLIRMQDDALGEFFSKYVSTALEMYLTAKQGAQALSPYVPFSTLPFSAGNALARAINGLALWGDAGQFGGAPYPQAQQAPQPSATPNDGNEVAALRSELEDIRREMRASKGRKTKA
jgi:polyhydroxyalkanoate synthesis repressor PhaR